MTTRNQPQELGPIPGCLCDLGISHPDIEPCTSPEISPVGGEFEICLGCGHDAKCHDVKAGE